MNYQTIEKSCESAPFLKVELTGKGWIALYWSLRAGTYGHQVYCVASDYETAHFSKSNGCGYCKESNQLELALRFLGIHPRGMTLGGEGIPHQYHIGGNFYRVPKKDQLRAK